MAQNFELMGTYLAEMLLAKIYTKPLLNSRLFPADLLVRRDNWATAINVIVNIKETACIDYLLLSIMRDMVKQLFNFKGGFFCVK